MCSFGLPFENIDCCESGCMLYWEDDENLTSCKFMVAKVISVVLTLVIGNSSLINNVLFSFVS